MLNKEKSSYQEIFGDLNLPEDALPLLENVLRGGRDLNSVGLENSNEDTLDSIQIFQKLRESGLTAIEKILDEIGKQALNIANNEISSLRKKVKKLEKTSEEAGRLKKITSSLESQVNTKKEIINDLNEKLSDAHMSIEELEEELKTKITGKSSRPEFYIEKEFKFTGLEKKNKELIEELQHSKEESEELKEKIKLMEDRVNEVTEEIEQVEELYQENISNLQKEVFGVVDKKQKEWEDHYTYINEERKKEILTLQRSKEEEILKYKQKLEAIEELNIRENPALGLFKSAVTIFKKIQ